MHYYEAIKAKALRSVLKPDTDYYLRRVYRWYSKTFHTPLETAFDLPVEFVLREYFEEYFENLEEEELDFQLEEVTETDEQRKQRLSAEDADKKAEQELLEMARNQNANKKIPGPSKLPEQITKLGEVIKEVAENIKEEMKSDPSTLPPEIDMKFESDEEFQKLLNADSNMLSDNDTKKP